MMQKKNPRTASSKQVCDHIPEVVDLSSDEEEDAAMLREVDKESEEDDDVIIVGESKPTSMSATRSQSVSIARSSVSSLGLNNLHVDLRKESDPKAEGNNDDDVIFLGKSETRASRSQTVGRSSVSSLGLSTFPVGVFSALTPKDTRNAKDSLLREAKSKIRTISQHSSLTSQSRKRKLPDCHWQPPALARRRTSVTTAATHSRGRRKERKSSAARQRTEYDKRQDIDNEIAPSMHSASASSSTDPVISALRRQLNDAMSADVEELFAGEVPRKAEDVRFQSKSKNIRKYKTEDCRISARIRFDDTLRQLQTRQILEPHMLSESLEAAIEHLPRKQRSCEISKSVKKVMKLVADRQSAIVSQVADDKLLAIACAFLQVIKLPESEGHSQSRSASIVSAVISIDSSSEASLSPSESPGCRIPFRSVSPSKAASVTSEGHEHVETGADTIMRMDDDTLMSGIEEDEGVDTSTAPIAQESTAAVSSMQHNSSKAMQSSATGSVEKSAPTTRETAPFGETETNPKNIEVVLATQRVDLSTDKMKARRKEAEELRRLLASRDNRNLQALVICQTRDEALVVKNTLHKIIKACGCDLRCSRLTGGQSKALKLELLRFLGGVDILVATPGRLVDLVLANSPKFIQRLFVKLGLVFWDEIMFSERSDGNRRRQQRVRNLDKKVSYDFMNGSFRDTSGVFEVFETQIQILSKLLSCGKPQWIVFGGTEAVANPGKNSRLLQAMNEGIRQSIYTPQRTVRLDQFKLAELLSERKIERFREDFFFEPSDDLQTPDEWQRTEATLRIIGELRSEQKDDDSYRIVVLVNSNANAQKLFDELMRESGFKKMRGSGRFVLFCAWEFERKQEERDEMSEELRYGFGGIVIATDVVCAMHGMWANAVIEWGAAAHGAYVEYKRYSVLKSEGRMYSLLRRGKQRKRHCESHSGDSDTCMDAAVDCLTDEALSEIPSGSSEPRASGGKTCLQWDGINKYEVKDWTRINERLGIRSEKAVILERSK